VPRWGAHDSASGARNIEPFDCAFELIFIPKAFLDEPDLPGPVDEKRHRKEVAHPIALRDFAVPENNRNT